MDGCGDAPTLCDELVKTVAGRMTCVLAPLLLVVGFVIGFVVSRWFALAAPAVFAVYIAVASGVDEVPPWFLGLMYGIVGALGVAGGVFARRRFAS